MSSELEYELFSEEFFYDFFKLENPEEFEKKSILHNCNYMLLNKIVHMNLHRQTGKTTKRIVTALSYKYQKNINVLYVCDNYLSIRYIQDELLKKEKIVNKIWLDDGSVKIKFITKYQLRNYSNIQKYKVIEDLL